VGRDFPTTPVPEGFDYDLWLGPALTAPFSPERVARGDELCYWYYISDYTVGFISSNGVHFVDIAQWGIGDEVRPMEVHTSSVEIPTDGLVDDATTTCNLAEISARLGRRVKWDAQGERFVDDDEANRLLSRAMRSPWHL